MKKLFVAVLALAALAACNKEEAPTLLESSKKSVSISILNGGLETRAKTTASADENFACAKEAELTVLFADNAGKVVESRALSAAPQKVEGAETPEGLVPTTYTFHKLPESVIKIGVIALRNNAVPATLDAAKDIWTTETKDAEVANIVVYGYGDLTRAKDEAGEDAFCVVDAKYPLFEGSVRVAPAHTRLEVLSFQCTDLATHTNDANGVYGYSKITLNKMTMGADVQELGNELKSATDVAYPDGDSTKAWSWNWLAYTDGDTTVEKARENLVVDLTVEGNGYDVPAPDKTLTINAMKYKKEDGTYEYVQKFEPEHIYKLNVPFLEANIDTDNSFICVDVEVAIANWIVVTLEPEFATNPQN